MSLFSRRFVLRSASGLLVAWGGLFRGKKLWAKREEVTGRRIEHWHQSHDRVFLGGDCWANPMEDWRVRDGWAECVVQSGKRNIHSLTHQIRDVEAPFRMSVLVDRPAEIGADGGAGFRIGVRSEIDELRSNCFANSGIDAGITGNKLVLGRESAALKQAYASGICRLILEGKPDPGPGYRLKLSAFDADGEMMGAVELAAQKRFVRGNISLVSQFQTAPQGRKAGASWRFTDWRAEGDAFSIDETQQFGPLLWSMYSLSDSRSDEGFVMKLSILAGPLGENDNHAAELWVNRSEEPGSWEEKPEQWESLGTSNFDTDAWVATYRIANWGQTREFPYCVVYRESHQDGSETIQQWSGKIKAEPVGRPLRIGALTCQNDYAFPYQPVAENLLKLDPDMLYFSGDQLYENHGGFGVIRAPAAPAILNYLRKFYQHGWAFREVMRDRPTLCIPDDHDVFQGNYWGESGAPMDVNGGTSSRGGYIQPVQMVNVVHKTNAAHHPDYHDPTPVLQGMSVYYGEMVYGGVGFAIISDRQFKSGPERVDTGGGRADHVPDKDFDTSVLDKPGLVLLGDRQEGFLQQWGRDWRGHTMKILLSQTLFANVATHHGEYDGYLKADLDSGSWPQTPRNRALSILKDSKALHINGDQHLTTVTRYGVQRQRDNLWSFCTPAIAVGYPRWWRPDEIGMQHENRPEHGLANTGEFVDGFGNYVYVYSVGNPEVGRDKNRYKKAHEKGSGFGLVTVDSAAETYLIEAFRFLVDATDGQASNQFPGWPVTIRKNGERVDG